VERGQIDEASIAKRVLAALEAANVTVWMTTQAAHGQAAAVVVPNGQVSQIIAWPPASSSANCRPVSSAISRRTWT